MAAETPIRRTEEIIVIGAGAAGLSAARELCKEGYSVVIVEARQRIGGRIHTLHRPGISKPLELGAEFVHGAPKHLGALADRHRFELAAGEGRHYEQANNGELEEGQFWSHIGPMIERLKTCKEDLSYDQFVRTYASDLPEETRLRARGFIEGFNAAPADDISVLGLSKEYSDGGEQLFTSRRVLSGYESVPKALLSDIPVDRFSLRLGHIVREVRWKKGEATIVGAGVSHVPFSFGASRVVITLPPSLLIRNALTFYPDLPSKREVAEQIGVGHVIKVFLRFEERWWDGDPKLNELSFLHAAREPIPTWWTMWPSVAPILVGWIGGPAADRMHRTPDDAMRDIAIGSVARIVGRTPADLDRKLSDFLMVDWQDDPFARGAYSYQRVGFPHAKDQLAQPVEDTLFFAGDATEAEGLSGTVESAIASGVRAAEEVIGSFREGRPRRASIPAQPAGQTNSAD